MLIPIHKTTGEGKKRCSKGSESLNQQKTHFFQFQFENVTYESFRNLAEAKTGYLLVFL